MRAFVFAGACLAGADIYREDGPAFRADLRNLLAGIRQNRSTQAHE